MKLGIVTISFNQAVYLQEAIDSVKLANPENLVYVIVDPGSKDGSREIIEQNRHRFSRLLLEPDKGPTDGLNKGFAACDADIYGYLNSDDRFVPGALDWVHAYFEQNPDIDLLLGAIRIIDQNGKPKFRGRAPDVPLDLTTFSHGASYFWQQATFFRRSLYEKTRGFNPDSRVAWDGELVLDMALAGARVGYTNVILGDFRIYADSITGSQRLAARIEVERGWFQERIAKAGHKTLTAAEEKRAKLFYKYNPLRHWNCTFGIKMPPAGS